ncbi:hypothetical protein GSI_07437 [Ganoderma sinense ZZ0214-1]|uniref:Uncharacterized protein n=1 Tax=Ganoderma sinense ZZ0214-1 TaxID=1077348 RepID=A0A2G8S921_9APHY|nr:hypothetical protein GSI_07437 [Ganoderma sinense ZZ0214-1]
MIPKSRKPKEDGNGSKPVKTKSKAKDTTSSPPRSAASRFRAPDINTHTSNDEAVEAESTASKKTTKTETSTKPVEDSSSDESDSKTSDDDEERSSSPSSGLEDLEKKNPGALKVKFESERPAWIDDHSQIPED